MIRIRLSALLGKRRISQTKLAKDTGISKGTINAYYNEYAERVSLDHLDTLCEYFGIELNELIEHIPNRRVDKY